ncbi:hypothetical protein [Sulfurospirillum sp. 1612]|uniref:hypothetical protein n=1 Tax=Sulfurospirillum sp. 1612 TaxID=3094835 RepID=UPI002F926101
MIEFKKQKSLINIANKTLPLPKKQKGLRAYRALIYNRFYEVLSHAFPIFFETIDHDAFEKSIYEFMRYGAKTPYIWQVPNEYRKFIKAKNMLREDPFVDDLLWFEWIEIKLLMQTHQRPKNRLFHFKNTYRLASNARVKPLHFRVFEHRFEQKGEYFLLSYYDFEAQAVHYREIAPALYLFLKNLNTHGLKKSIKILAHQSHESIKNVKQFLKPALQELCEQGILTNKKKRK